MLNIRGWIAWKVYDAGARGLGHRIFPDEIPRPTDHSDTLNAALSALVSEHMDARGITVAELSRRTGIRQGELRRHLGRCRKATWWINDLNVIGTSLGVGVLALVKDLEWATASSEPQTR